jgi:hypothetical protein
MRSKQRNIYLEAGKLKSDSQKSKSFTFPIIAKAHLSLSKANCVFSLTDAIKLLQLCLIDTLHHD